MQIKAILINVLVAFLLAMPVPELMAAENLADIDAEAKTGPGPTVVQIPVVLLPLADENGRLLRYAFATIELEIPRATDRWSVEDLLPVIKDAFVRELHHGTNIVAGNPDQLDIEGIRTRLFARVNEIVSDGRVGSVIFRDVAAPQ